MNQRQWAIALIGVLLVGRMVLAATTGLVEDEVYYWTWSQHLAAGYFDHPPMIAWVIASSDWLLGRSSLGLRLSCVVLGGLLPLLLLRQARHPLLLTLLLGALPLYTLGGVMATPDVPLLFGWALALRGAMTGAWGLAGLGAGMAGLSKYTGWGIWPLLVAAELHKAWTDRRLGKPSSPNWGGMVLGFVLSLCCMAPNLYWNYLNHWVSIAFQLHHGLGAKAAGVGSLLEFFGAQVLLVTPVLFGAIVAWWIDSRRSFFWGAKANPDWQHVDRICWWTSLPVLGFFCFAASRSHGEVNWAAPAWIGACVALSRSRGRVLRAAWLGGGFALVLSALVVVHLYMPLVDIKGDPTERLGIGADLAQSVKAWDVEPVYTTRYQEAAILRYYGDIEAYTLPGVDRQDQFDLWPMHWRMHALFVRPWRGATTVVIDKFCKTRSGPNTVTQYNVDGAVFGRWQVYEVKDCGRQGKVDVP